MGSDHRQFVPGLGFDLSSEDPFSLQMDSWDARSRITCEPINGVKVVFLEAVTIFADLKKINPLLNSFTASCLYSKCNSVLLFKGILKQDKINSPFQQS